MSETLLRGETLRGGRVIDGHGECFIEVGGGKAGLCAGSFYAEARPAVSVRRPSRMWRLGKVLLEKQIPWRWL